MMSYVCRMQISQSYNLTIFAQDHFYFGKLLAPGEN